MGNIASHSLITRHVGAGLKSYLPTEDIPFIALGNFLTDVSQFRDPTAQIGAQLKTYGEALVNTPAPWFRDLQLSYADAREWIDALLGVGTATPPHGALFA